MRWEEFILGHIHLGVLPRSKSWREVVTLLDDGAASGQVIGQAAIAAEKDLAKAATDRSLVEALRLLAMIPVAARTDDFIGALRRLGVDVPPRPGFGDLLSGVAAHLDDVARDHGRTDVGELARRALIATLSNEIGDALPRLFGATPEEVRTECARMAAPQAFAKAARVLLGRVVADLLSSWLDRTLSTHVGRDRRLADAAARSAFDAALVQYCAEATRIIREFGAGWQSATLHRVGAIGAKEAQVFTAVALKKITAELREKRTSHG